MISLVDIPLTVHYDFPERLGLDRAVAAYAGINLIGLGRPFGDRRRHCCYNRLH